MAEKTCTQCHGTFALDCFYKHPYPTDGRASKCKECTKANVRNNYARKREEKSAYERRRNATPERRARRAEYMRAHRARYPEKYAARNAVSIALRDGKLARGPCEWCGTEERVQAHHHDYLKPLDVTWACFKCHREHEHGQVVVSAWDGSTARAATG